MARFVALFLLLLPVTAWGQSVRDAEPLPGPARTGARVVLLPESQQILLYGGLGLDPVTRQRPSFEDLWLFDLSIGHWERIPKSDPWPGSRYYYSMALDASREGLFLYGGIPEAKPPSSVCGNELWHFESTTRRWQLLESGLPNAPPGFFGGMSIDPMSGDPWIFFGTCFEGCNWYFARFNRSTAQWSGSAAPRDIPGGRNSPAAPYDSRRSTMLIRGGQPPLGCAFSPSGNDVTALDPHALWAFDPQSSRWRGLGALGSGPARLAVALADYDAISDVYLQYGGRASTVVSDSLWAFDMRAQAWSLLLDGDARSRLRYDAAGVYCPCRGELFVTTGAESTANGAPEALRSDAYFLRVEDAASFEWDGAGNSRNAPWRWGTLTLDDDGQIDPSTVRLVNCAAGEDLQGATEAKRMGRDRWHLRFAAATADENEALAGGHLVLTGRVPGRPVNFLARVQESREFTQRLSPSSSLRCEPVAGGWSVQYTGENPELARLQVFDVAGRLKARLDAPFAGGRTLIWDGRDGEGHRLPNGIYFLRVAGGEGVAKAVVIR